MSLSASQAAALSYSCERAADALHDVAYRLGELAPAGAPVTRSDVDSLMHAAGIVKRVMTDAYAAERAAIAAATAVSAAGEGQRDG